MDVIPIPGESLTVPAALVREISADFERFMRALPIIAALQEVTEETCPAAFWELQRAGVDLDEIVATQHEIVAILRAMAGAADARAARSPAARLH